MFLEDRKRFMFILRAKKITKKLKVIVIPPSSNQI